MPRQVLAFPKCTLWLQAYGPPAGRAVCLQPQRHVGKCQGMAINMPRCGLQALNGAQKWVPRAEHGGDPCSRAKHTFGGNLAPENRMPDILARASGPCWACSQHAQLEAIPPGIVQAGAGMPQLHQSQLGLLPAGECFPSWETFPERECFGPGNMPCHIIPAGNVVGGKVSRPRNIPGPEWFPPETFPGEGMYSS